MKNAWIFGMALLAACSGASSSSDEQALEALDPEDVYQGDYFEGVLGDEERQDDIEDGGDLGAYPIPSASELPALASPEIIVSLGKPTVVHLFDRTTGFSAVYPTGVGMLGASGKSITPSGHFTVGSGDIHDGWYWTQRRNWPAYFAGLPFLRLSIHNSQGAQTYGLHGPITQELKQGYVSHGCMRMAPGDVIALFWMLYYQREREPAAPLTPVSIVPGQALDRSGQVLDAGMHGEVWQVGEPIDWAAMGIAPRP